MLECTVHNNVSECKILSETVKISREIGAVQCIHVYQVGRVQTSDNVAGSALQETALCDATARRAGLLKPLETDGALIAGVRVYVLPQLWMPALHDFEVYSLF